MDPIQLFVAQPSEDGFWEVAKWNDKDKNYIAIEKCLTEENARELASELNAEEKL